MPVATSQRKWSDQNCSPKSCVIYFCWVPQSDIWISSVSELKRKLYYVVRKNHQHGKITHSNCKWKTGLWRCTELKSANILRRNLGSVTSPLPCTQCGPAHRQRTESASISKKILYISPYIKEETRRELCPQKVEKELLNPTRRNNRWVQSR